MNVRHSTKFFIATILIAVVYVVTTIYLMNATLVWDTLTEEYPLRYRADLLTALLGGMWTAMTPVNLILLILVALLTGATLTLVIARLRTLRSSGKLYFAVGGSSLLGLVGSGCASCGLPILALLGLSGAAANLPFRGVELSVTALVLLSISLFLLLKNPATGAATCAVRLQKPQKPKKCEQVYERR